MHRTTERSRALRRSRRAFSIGSWLVLLWVGIGFVTTVPAVDSWLTWVEGTRLGQIAVVTAIVLMGASAVFLWAAALRYAALATESKGPARVALFSVLVLGNFVAAFFYYFLKVKWESGDLGRSVDGEGRTVPQKGTS